MERLTMRNSGLRLAIPKKAYEDYHGDRPLDCSSFCDTQIDCVDCPIGQCFDKLALYEDTGLQPEELDPDIIQNAYDELADYETAEEQGKLIKFPVAIGDHIWQIVGDRNGERTFVEYIVTGFNVMYDGAKFATIGRNAINPTEAVNLAYWGKTLFKTSEEAESKLEELEAENER